LVLFFLVLLRLFDVPETATHRIDPWPLLTHRVDSYMYHDFVLAFVLKFLFLFVFAVLCANPIRLWQDFFSRCTSDTHLDTISTGTTSIESIDEFEAIVSVDARS
jgi:hypothetical protein